MRYGTRLRDGQSTRSFFIYIALSTTVAVTVTLMLFPSSIDTLLCFLAAVFSRTTAFAARNPSRPLLINSLPLGADYETLYPTPPGDHVYGDGRLGAVASENAICTGIGRDLLLRGGNAADALVGTTFCVGVIGMYHSGIGGGGFMLVRGSDGEYEYIDFRETAPAAAFQDMYNNDALGSIFGGLASGIPGEVRGLGYLHDKYGKLPWREVMQGAIDTARYGFPVTADLVRYMAAATANDTSNFLVDDPNWAIDFAPNGTLLGLGNTITRKRYANTLESIAENGPDVFYEGPMAEAMIDSLQAANGTMTLADLANYTVAIRPPAEIDYRGYKLHSLSAPASGTVTLSILKIIEGYPDIGAPSSLNISTHRLNEAMRFAYGQRASMGDPDFLPNMEAHEADMLNETTAAHIRGKISDDHTLNVSAYNPSGFENSESHGTSHVVTADASGLAISLTTTINLLFGSRVLVPETGVILNNEMDDFSIPGRKNAFGFVPSPANYIRPGKRPLSSIACTIVETADGALYFVTGAAGGSRIATATLLTLWGVLDRDMTSAEALAMPRMHDQLVPNRVELEVAFDNGTAAFLESRGHEIMRVNPVWSSAQCLRRREDGRFEAAGEPRQKASAGYAV